MFAARAISNSTRIARTTALRVVLGAGPKRGMSGPPPKYTGWEAKIREKLPKDEQVVVAIFSFYVCLYGLFKIVKPSSSPEPAAPPPPAISSSSEIPSGYGDDFWQWLDGPGNMEKYLATIEQ